MSPSQTAATNWMFPGCPEPPDWRLDWDRLCAERPEIAALHHCPQDPVHHAEGDVGLHTRRVCSELTGLEAWRQLHPEERSILFAAALYHDVAKPLCTRDEMGQISARVMLGAGHEWPGWRSGKMTSLPRFPIRRYRSGRQSLAWSDITVCPCPGRARPT